MLNKLITTLASVLLVSASYAGMQTDRPYQELGRAQHFNLRVPGYVLGIEKRSIYKEDKTLLEGIDNADRPYEPRFVPPVSAGGEGGKTQDKVFKRATSDLISKVMLVTHITKSVTYEGQHYSQYLYNAYGEDLDGQYNFAESFAKVDLMFADMAMQLKQAKEQGEPFTHVIVMSMGWNNDQVESLYRYNTIIKNVQQEALAQQQAFKPLVICFTWPSVWGGVTDSVIFRTAKHLASYVNKTDDADELGYTWGNWVVNKKIPDALAEAGVLTTKPKVVLIGHSFGARFLSRALFSAPYINAQFAAQNTVDVFLGLQGAFSLRRFVADAGVEGSPYAGFTSLPGKVVLTSSTHDTSNLAALWSANAGGPQGLSYARKTPQVFNVVNWGKNGSELTAAADKVTLVDASEMVKRESDKIDAHNDILDAQMAKLIWAVIH
ncbi:MAG: hypothetical protein U1F46_16795 [Marinagarivorans sp.]